MKFTDAKYIKDVLYDKVDTISVTFENEVIHVPMDENNIHYAEIMKQVKAKTLTIADAD
jgi:hypothetical protein